MGDAVYLFSERGVTALAGGRIEAVAPLLDGTRDMDTLLRDIGAPDLSREQLLQLINRLADAGLVAPRQAGSGQTVTDEPALAYWEANGLDPVRATQATTAPVRLWTVGDIDHGQALTTLAGSGLAMTGAEGTTSALSVVLCDDYLAPDLREIDTTHRREGRPWLLARPVGERVWIGPIFGSGPDIPCWHCLADRLWGHRPAEAHVQTMLGRRRPVRRPVATVPALATAALNLVALEAVKWLAGQRYPGQQTIWTFDSADLEGRRHEVRRRPQCRACGDPALMRRQALQPVVLVPRPKRSSDGGGHRALRPEQVLDRYRHLVSPVSGVIKDIRRDPRGPHALNVFRSGPVFARNTRCIENLRSSLRMQNGGKGITALHAEASALCEALERYCATYQGDEETVEGSLKSLGEQAIDPSACQLFHERQFATREAWNAAHGPFQHVCRPFDPDAALRWSPVWSLTEQRHRLLPTGLLYFGVRPDHAPPSIMSDSNGNAAGGSIEDAVLQGLLEVVERDAVALWWYNRTRQPAVDLDSFGERWIDELRECYTELSRDLWVLDLTADLEIPVMVALSRRLDKPCEDIMLGFGAHRDPRVALRRALTELNQLLPAVLEIGHGEDGYGHRDPDAVRWWRGATVANQPYLLPDLGTPPRTPRHYPHEQCEDLREDVESIHSRLRDQHLEMLVLNQTRPDIDLPVVKVIVPGMRHFWARFAPGRLFDVPVRLGRLARPTAYEDLNPLPLFL